MTPPVTPPDATAALHAAVRNFFLAHYPGVRPTKLTVEADGLSCPVTMPVPAPRLAVELSPAGQAVVDWFRGEPAAAHADGQELATHTGYAYAAHLKRELAALVKAGVLSPGPDGYARGPQFPG